MFEHIVQMGPMRVLAGVMAGWVAEVVSRADGHGFIRDMVLGLVGSVVGAATVWVVISSEAGDAGDVPGRVRRRDARDRRSAEVLGLFPHDLTTAGAWEEGPRERRDPPEPSASSGTIGKDCG